VGCSLVVGFLCGTSCGGGDSRCCCPLSGQVTKEVELHGSPRTSGWVTWHRARPAARSYPRAVRTHRATAVLSILCAFPPLSDSWVQVNDTARAPAAPDSPRSCRPAIPLPTPEHHGARFGVSPDPESPRDSRHSRARCRHLPLGIPRSSSSQTAQTPAAAWSCPGTPFGTLPHRPSRCCLQALCRVGSRVQFVTGKLTLFWLVGLTLSQGVMYSSVKPSAQNGLSSTAWRRQRSSLRNEGLTTPIVHALSCSRSMYQACQGHASTH
jgi:hypothetical protein